MYICTYIYTYEYIYIYICTLYIHMYFVQDLKRRLHAADIHAKQHQQSTAELAPRSLLYDSEAETKVWQV